VDIYPGFAASEVLYGRQGEVVGVATGDVGIAKDGTQKDAFARGMELRSRVTLLAEGCRGSLSEVKSCFVHAHGRLTLQEKGRMVACLDGITRRPTYLTTVDKCRAL